MHRSLWRGLLAAIAGLPVGASLAVRPAQAQNFSFFCPNSVTSTGAINGATTAFQGNGCVGGGGGAYSNAALATQSVSDLAQTSSQESSRAFQSVVAERRRAAADERPTPVMRSVSRFAPESPLADPWDAMPAEMLSFAPQSKAYAADLRATPRAAPPIEQVPRLGIWANGYGDYERRSGQSQTIGPLDTSTPLGLDARSTSWSSGVLGGIDVTSRSIASSSDGLITGLLAGFMSSHSTLNTVSNSSNTVRVNNGLSSLKAQLSGPVAGLYASYFNGGFSTDLAVKVEFLDLNLAFTDLLGFGSAPNTNDANPNLGSATFSNNGTTRLNNYSAGGNVNYRWPAAANIWVEPTAGFQYTRSDYAANAGVAGLADGSLLRLQGGARLGIESSWNTVRMTTVVTALLYDNVSVSGGLIQTSPANPVILSDQGKLRAQGILALNFQHGNGISSFLQGDIRGGDALIGAGGKAGVRMVW
jgi:hypothetical protein